MVDRDLVMAKLAAMERYLGELSEYRAIDAETYASDWKTQRIVERTVHLVVETAVDIAGQLVADRLLPVPDTDAAAFVTLAEDGVLENDLAGAPGRIVACRNILAHARLDPAIVLRILHTDLLDIERFRSAVLRAI